VSCAGTSRAAIKDLDKSAARREPPSNTEPNDATANDGDLWFADAREAIRHDAAPFAGMTQTGSTGLISAANTPRHPGPSVRMMGICAPFYKRITGEQVRCREAKGQAAKVTVVLGPTNNLILKWAECPRLGVKRTSVARSPKCLLLTQRRHRPTRSTSPGGASTKRRAFLWILGWAVPHNMTTPTTIIGQATIAALSIRRTY